MPPAATANNEAPLLLWEGPALFDEDQTECHRLVVTKDHQALIGRCDNADQQLLLSQENGYCLLYPAEYSLAQLTRTP